MTKTIWHELVFEGPNGQLLAAARYLQLGRARSELAEFKKLRRRRSWMREVLTLLDETDAHYVIPVGNVLTVRLFTDKRAVHHAQEAIRDEQDGFTRGRVGIVGAER